MEEAQESGETTRKFPNIKDFLEKNIMQACLPQLLIFNNWLEVEFFKLLVIFYLLYINLNF